MHLLSLEWLLSSCCMIDRIDAFIKRGELRSFCLLGAVLVVSGESDWPDRIPPSGLVPERFCASLATSRRVDFFFIVRVLGDIVGVGADVDVIVADRP